MSAIVGCSSCSTRYKVRSEAVGKRVRCPSCGHAFVAAALVGDAEIAEPEARGAGPKTVKASVENAVTETKRPKVKQRSPVENIEEDLAEEEAAEDRPRKKKKKKKKARRNPAWAFLSPESRPMVLFGASGILAVEFALLAFALILPNNNPAKFFMAYFFAMLPISTMVFFVSMIVASLFGALEVGEIPSALVKGFFLIVIVNIVSLAPCGFFLTSIVWFCGIMTMFRLDVWETRMLIGINWILNLIAQVAILTLLATLMPRAIGLEFDDEVLPAEEMVWDADVITQLDGRVGFVNNDDEEVHSISLANRPIHDAHLAHMKDFPQLVRLDLTNRVSPTGALSKCANAANWGC